MFFGHMLPAPVLLGRVAPARQEAVKALQVPPSQASNRRDESRKHGMNQISWSQRCPQATFLAVAMLLAAGVSAVVGWKCLAMLGTSY